MEWRPGAVGALLILAHGVGCGSEVGIERETSLAAMPDPECVSKALRSIQAVGAVEEEVTDSGVAYRYRGEGFGGRLFFQESESGAAFLDEAVFGSGAPSAEQVATTRRMMQAVETRIAFFCRIPELGAGVPERCVGIDCGDAS